LGCFQGLQPERFEGNFGRQNRKVHDQDIERLLVSAVDDFLSGINAAAGWTGNLNVVSAKIQAYRDIPAVSVGPELIFLVLPLSRVNHERSGNGLAFHVQHLSFNLGMALVLGKQARSEHHQHEQIFHADKYAKTAHGLQEEFGIDPKSRAAAPGRFFAVSRLSSFFRLVLFLLSDFFAKFSEIATLD
jgi:hypothetical protein